MAVNNKESINTNYYDFGVKSNIAVLRNESSQAEDTLKDFIKLMESKEIVNFTFAQADENGNLIKFIGDVKVVMSNMDCTDNGKSYDAYYKASMLIKSHDVVVTNVDSENFVVTMSHTVAYRKLRNKFSSRLAQALAKKSEIKEGEEIVPVVVPAKIKTIMKDRNVVVLDLNGYGVPGYIANNQWSHRSGIISESEAKPGDTLMVEVMYYKKQALGKNGIGMYCCSRKSILPDPWKGIEERFKVKDVVRIRCVERRRKSWFGTIEGLNDIQVFCEYPDAAKNPGLHILEGQEYQGFIYSVSEEKKLLKARVFGQIL